MYYSDLIITKDYLDVLSPKIIYTCLKNFYHMLVLFWDSSVWNLDNFICNSNNIENIQIYFTKILFYRCNLTKRSYKDRINFLNINTLFHRKLLLILPWLIKY